MLAGPPAQADLGRWTSLHDIGGVAIHMALVPGDNDPYHSRIVWWENRTRGGELGWIPGNDDCSLSPSSTLSPIAGTWNTGVNVFCSSNVMLPSGKILAAGGTEDPHFGIREARIFTPGTGTDAGTWGPAASMSVRRYYPTATSVGGRVAVASGTRFVHLWCLGGRRDGAPPVAGTGDELQRFGPISGGIWDASVTPDPDPVFGQPVPAEGQATAYLEGEEAQVYLGGRDNVGSPVGQFLRAWLLRRLPNPTGADYTYKWERLDLDPASPLPDPRSDHTALAVSKTEIVVFGGLGGQAGSEIPLNDMWRLFKDPQSETWKWELVQITSGTPPTPRYGHAAVYDVDLLGVRRMILFGGAESFGQAPTDNNVHVFKFDSQDASSGSWSVHTPANAPAPRLHHTLVWSETDGSAFLYGGDLGGGMYSAEIWELRSPFDGFVEWNGPLTVTGDSPGPRARHAAVFHTAGERMLLFGGDSAPGTAADKYVYRIFGLASERWQEAAFHLSGHTATLDPFQDNVARVLEIYDPATDSWSSDPVAALEQATYPVHFAVPGASDQTATRLVAVGPASQARWIDIPASGAPAMPWQTMAAATSGFSAQTGVTYAPGKILIAGGRGDPPVGTTKWLDATNPTKEWNDLDAMEGRYYHNLVLLPTGQVLALGGIASTSTEVAGPPVLRPQIRDPESGTWSSMTDPATRLAEAGAVRNYHSTAVLLPSGQVVCGGGWTSGNPDKTKLEIFCPPYLFKPDGSPITVRPEIQNAPAIITWGQSFTVCTPNPTEITRVSLIRPGVTTHAFDENQRYVRLDHVPATNPNRLLVTAPASADSAPPGYYLLFLTGSSDGTDVPSIGRWIQVVEPGGTDLCDTVEPGALSDLAVDLVSQTAVYTSWTATADDGLIGASGAARRFDLRHSPNPIDTENNWSLAAQASGEPAPGPLATLHEHEEGITGLQPCTWYHLAIRADDDNQNLSALHGEVKVKTLCGGGGGGFAAREILPGAETATAGGTGNDGGATGVAAGGADVTAPSASSRHAATTSLRAAGATLVVETDRRAAGGWTVRVTRASSVEGLDAETGPGVIVQARDAAGVWRTNAHYRPGLQDDLLGTGALREGGRIVLADRFVVDRVASTIRCVGGTCALAAASHSRDGELATVLVTASGGVSLAEGETLTLQYVPAEPAGAAAEDWYLLVRRDDATEASRGRAPAVAPAPIGAFTLHQNEPNPFGGRTTIRFDLPLAAPVRLEVFDLLGRRVRRLVDARLEAGRHAVEWDQRGDGGLRVAPGIYAYRLTAGVFRAERKLVVAP